MNDGIMWRGIVGLTTPLCGLITSFQEHIEWTLRLTSLTIGCVVGVLSAIGIVRKLKKNG